MDTKENHFREIFEKFYSPLCNYAFKFLGDKDEAEEIVQDLFLNFWESRKLESVEHKERYLIRSVKFKCIDHLKKSRIKHDFSIIDVNDLQAISAELSEEEVLPLLTYFAAKLPPKTREVFLLSRKSGMTYKQISEELEISVKTVESQMGRALKYMRKLLKEHGILTFLLKI